MIFYFLWGDTVFSESLEQLASYVDHSVIESRRKVALTAIDSWFEVLACEEAEHQKTTQRFLNAHHRLTKAYWMILELRKHVAPEVWQYIKRECAVNALDPDFSFDEALERLLIQKPGS